MTRAAFLLVAVTMCAAMLGRAGSLAAPGRGIARPVEVWGEEAGGYRLGLTLAQEEFAAGRPIVMGVVVQNVSDQPRRIWWRESPWATFDVKVERCLGFTKTGEALGAEEVPLTLEGLRLAGQLAIADEDGMEAGILEPSGRRAFYMMLTEARDMSLQGVYTISVSYTIDGHVLSAGPLQLRIGYAYSPAEQSAQILWMRSSAPGDDPFCAAGAVASALELGVAIERYAHVLRRTMETDPSPAVKREAEKALFKLRALLEERRREAAPGSPDSEHVPHQEPQVVAPLSQRPGPAPCAAVRRRMGEATQED